MPQITKLLHIESANSLWYALLLELRELRFLLANLEGSKDDRWEKKQMVWWRSRLTSEKFHLPPFCYSLILTALGQEACQMSPGLSRNMVQTICILKAPIGPQTHTTLSQLRKPFPPVEGRFSWALLGMHYRFGLFAYHDPGSTLCHSYTSLKHACHSCSNI